ncbi:hypothetical protein X975_21202, partial [Stegodyphus mimosarum]
MLLELSSKCHPKTKECLLKAKADKILFTRYIADIVPSSSKSSTQSIQLTFCQVRSWYVPSPSSPPHMPW